MPTTSSSQIDAALNDVSGERAEILYRIVEEALKQEITRSLQASMGFLLSKDAFRSFKKRLD